MPDNNPVSFPSVTSIAGWARSSIRYLGGAPEAPYVLKDGMYCYFSFRDGIYTLFCTSIRDLNEEKGE